jgi:hypothetical protein
MAKVNESLTCLTGTHLQTKLYNITVTKLYRIHKNINFVVNIMTI